MAVNAGAPHTGADKRHRCLSELEAPTALRRRCPDVSAHLPIK